MSKRMNLASVILVFLFSTAALAEKAELPTVPSVDLSKYIGKWHEVASIPQSFQKKCVANTTAEYSLAEDDLIKVFNSCDKSDGTRNEAEGRARIEDKNSNSKLKVTFVKVIDWVFLFGGDYWIIDLASDYSYAVVGDPSREYAWILSRTPSIELETLKGIAQRLVQNGYDTSKILTSVQTGGFEQRIPLSEVVK